jgi:hypothetical protein
MGPIWTYFLGLLEHMLLEEEPVIQTLAINAIQAVIARVQPKPPTPVSAAKQA